MNGDSYSSREVGTILGDRDERRDRHMDRDRDRNREQERDHHDRERHRDRDRDRDRDRNRERPRDVIRERRRSRSPDHRGTRRMGGDADAYSSSRSHRDREREDRYGGGGPRDRRGDREWDRDRGASRRDPRRDDEERPSRMERDPYDDRRRGGRDRRDDGGFGRPEPRRSPTPPAKREPTPDLTDIVSVLDRKRRLTQWDIKPPGYDLVTAEQAKLSGMFPLPGAPRQQPMDPSKLQAMMSQPGNQVTSAGLKASNSRQSKRLIVSNFSQAVTEDDLISFFNLQLNGLNVIETRDPCVLCHFSTDRSFAVLEFKEALDATVALAFDGTIMDADDAANGSNPDTAGLVIKRPNDYVMAAVPDEIIPHDPNVVSNFVPDTLHKLSVTNIPPFLTEEQVIELLAAFGKLKAFVLVRDRGSEESSGIAFAEFLEPGTANEPALSTLNGMDVGGRRLKVAKASSGSTQVANFDIGITAISGLASQSSAEPQRSRVLQLLNMVTAEELLDNDDYEEICDDVRGECAKFGTILDLKVPRPSGGSRQSAGVGKIFVKFESAESTNKALNALAGRKFADRTVVTTFFPEENFDVGAW
ncbi:U2 snRNP auxilliary factor, large subunit, splicing factor [Drechmeria coniospora]|uniref:U2 snRNP auxilliary factor, large subunit, splicing factor n=1 Tax=Drechmeria coniospora TaxID=98403 RepID=A0A151GIE4_DRECN|nr:U2 snRNP auxilliary factor, large subunit, splicing factor [Drechmeria coniospora]KYK56849.1 U2 snRNP auxilliary factor, large subunit, splicing factor [Drechmeria coniospora]